MKENSKKLKKISFKDFIENSNFDSLIDEYKNISISGNTYSCDLNNDFYINAEKSNILDIYAYYFHNCIVGIIITITTTMPHYRDKKFTVIDSIFLSKKYRKMFDGIYLIKKAEEIARDRKSNGILLTSPIEESLSKIAEKFGYIKSHHIFINTLQNKTHE